MTRFLGLKFNVRETLLHAILLQFLWSSPVDGVSVTFTDRYLNHGHVITSSFADDWLRCILSCQGSPECVSYNFDKDSGLCELSDHGLTRETDAEKALTQAKNFIFHQIRPASKKAFPLTGSAEHQCDCSCAGQSACTPNPDANNKYLAQSCKDLLEKTGITTNGAYDIQLPPQSTRTRVYCHMQEVPGCGGGGWTLVMKINGSKPTFEYQSSLWTSKRSHSPLDGQNLADKETKLPTYWGMPFTRLCLGMRNNTVVRWMRLDHTAPSLYDVISNGSLIQTGLPVASWKSVLDSSSIQRNCTKQGFNIHSAIPGTASARIGIIGYPSERCSASHSRIGFGTSGTVYGMKPNSCGNEARNKADNGDISFATFGYIMIQ